MNPDRDFDIDDAKFEFLWPKAYPYYSKVPLLKRFVKKLVKDDIVQFGQLFEKALAVQLGLERKSTSGYDFKNGADAKCVAVRTSSYGTQYGAPVTNIHAKTGNLLISCYERKQKKWYFFKIPHEAYKSVPKTSNIEIPFELDGTPRKTPRRLSNRYDWWKYEVKSFKDLK